VVVQLGEAVVVRRVAVREPTGRLGQKYVVVPYLPDQSQREMLNIDLLVPRALGQFLGFGQC
jgi:hypothetical protein